MDAALLDSRLIGNDSFDGSEEATRYHGLLLQVRHGFAADVRRGRPRWPEQSAAKDPSICMGICVASIVFTQLCCCVCWNQFLTRDLQREPDHNMPASTEYLPHLRTSAADSCRTCNNNP